MTRTAVLAELLYRKAVALKGMKMPFFWSKAKRNQLLEALRCLHFITNCLQSSVITDNQADEILSILENDFHYTDVCFTDNLKNASKESDRSPDYINLISEMTSLLSVCISEASAKRLKKENISRMLFAFHNYPRAFLSLADHRKITPAEAKEYTHSYLK
jgi:hypothetical protein